MSILDQLLGGGGDSDSVGRSSNDSNTEIGANPGLGLSLDDVLSFSSRDDDDGESSDFTGIGGLDLGFGSPIFLGTSSSSDSASAQSSDDGGGLLGGLL